MNGVVDFDLGGVVGIRLLGAGPREEAAVSRQLGPLHASLTGEPDLVVRFVDDLALRSPVRTIGLEDAGFTDDDFLILRGKHKSRVRARIPFESLGQPGEIVCERGLAAVPLLVPIVNLIALGKGYLPLHAAAFEHRGRGVVATGWSKGGKTETLLAFMANGARYVGDEWVYLASDGSSMFGIPEPIRVWSWHLDSLPVYRRALSSGQRARLSMLRWVEGGMSRMTANGARHGSAATRTLNRLSALVRGELCVDLPPGRLFAAGRNGAATPAAGLDLPENGVCRARPETILFVLSHELDEITVRPIPADEVAGRMLFSLQEEGARLTSAYHKFRFAFPGRVNPLLENARELQSACLKSALAGKPALEVRHPYPVSLTELYRAVGAALE